MGPSSVSPDTEVRLNLSSPSDHWGTPTVLFFEVSDPRVCLRKSRLPRPQGSGSGPAETQTTPGEAPTSVKRGT